MESHALDRAGLNSIPVNSLKGYFGHTLGAAGILETAAGIRSMREGVLAGTKGLDVKGTIKDINVINQPQYGSVNHCLKLASGFGGCNAVILLSKDGTYGL
jgi:3-oxoacyl-[acyl-carrier-protein] synthase-1